MAWFHPKTLLDKTYEIGLILKAVNGTFELIGGILVLALSPNAINGVTRFLTESALETNPHNYIAVHIAKAGADLASGHNIFAAAFLLTHGLVKVVLVFCLLTNRLWAYPWALVLLSVFLVYQAYQLITSPSLGMAFLTVLDIFIIWLINREWKVVKQEQATKAKHKTAPVEA
jgi:uncharacterized membrane protein